jgi:uncharacterized protein (DUF885 family)
MKLALKIFGGLLAGILLLAGAAFVQVWYFKPWSIDIFYEKIFLKFVLDDPETLSQLRILEPMGIESHNAKLTDASVARQQKLAKMARTNLATLHAYNRDRLDDGRQLSYDVLDWFLTNGVEGEAWMFHNYPVNQLFGVQNNLPTFMVNVHQIRDLRGARHYVARLEQFPRKFRQTLEGLKLRESMGIIPPKFTVEKVLTEMRNFIEAAPDEHLLYTHLQSSLDRLEGVTGADKAAVLEAGRAAVADAVIPAYRELIAYFEALQPKATTNHGVWALPDGDRYYAWCVKNHTTTDMSPEQIHQIGLSEVGRIEAEMNAILMAEGYRTGSVGARLTALALEPRFQYPDTDEARAQILADYQAIIDEIDAGLDPYFDLRPKVGVKVERIPEFREQTAPGAYYNPPPLDGSRPGVFYANLRDVREIYTWGMRTLAYHEATPGHHFQIAIAQELQGVPTFRRLGLFTVYVEGWALYAEYLAKELGYQDDPYDDLGRLQAEMMRAVRLVVDTGLHHKKWTREQAIEYFLEKTGQPEADVVSEIERYIVMPGQALAYKVGMLKILELREQARLALGPAFDLREFHNVVLRDGALPIAVLEQQVQRYIESKMKI